MQLAHDNDLRAVALLPHVIEAASKLAALLPAHAAQQVCFSCLVRAVGGKRGGDATREELRSEPVRIESEPFCAFVQLCRPLGDLRPSKPWRVASRNPARRAAL